MLEVRAVMSATSPSFGPADRAPDEYCSPEIMCEDCYTECNGDTGSCIPCDVEPLLDTVCAEETITSAEDYVILVKKWQERKAAGTTSSFLVLHCNLLGPEGQILRQKLGLKRNTSIHIVYSDVREDGDPLPGSGVNLENSGFKDTWRMEMREKTKIVKDPTAVFRGNGIHSLNDITLEDLLVMYVPSIFAELYAHSLSALMNSLHTFTPFLDDGRRRGGKVKAPAPACCLENAVTHSQRKRTSARDQALYDSANLVATQLYHGVASHMGSQICQELEHRGIAIPPQLRIGLEDETVPFHNLYVARGGAVPLRRAHDVESFEIVCWTCYGSPDGGEFVIPGLMYKFHTGQGSTVLFRPNRFYHATLPPENRDSVNEKFAVALIS